MKTRLCPPLSPEEAALLAEAFLLDELDALSRLPGVEIVLAVAPADALTRFRQIVGGRPVRLEPQAEGDLGARLLHAFTRGAGMVTAVIGTDSPDLPPDRVSAAFDVLEQDAADVVLGPTADGGYYLVAARQPHPPLFRDIPWSGPEVLSATLARAAEAGLRVHLLEPWEDVDVPEDLRRLEHRLAAALPLTAPRTREVLSRLSS